jgi:hypothetical protein
MTPLKSLDGGLLRARENRSNGNYCRVPVPVPVPVLVLVPGARRVRVRAQQSPFL